MLTKIRKSRLIRLSLLLTVLMLVSAWWIKKVQYNIAHSYAITYSLGNGRGFTYYCPKYYDLDPILQESVHVHEDRHLEKGGYAFWRHSELEIDAYKYQIEEIDKRLTQLSELATKTGKHEYWYKMALLRNFRADMVHHMRRYQGLELPDNDEGE